MGLVLVTPATGLVVTAAEARAHCRQSLPDDDSLLAFEVAAAQERCELEISGNRQLLSATYDLPVSDWWECLSLPRPPLQQVLSVSYYDAAGVLQTASPSLYTVRTPWRQPGVIEVAPNATWPALQSTRNCPITVRFVAGYGPSTTVALAISTGAQTVTPASMYGIYAGTRLRIEPGFTTEETVTVTSVTSTTFTATFSQPHSPGVTVIGAVPAAIRQAVFLTVAHSYRFRGDDADRDGPVTNLPPAARRLLDLQSWGFYG